MSKASSLQRRLEREIIDVINALVHAGLADSQTYPSSRNFAPNSWAVSTDGDRLGGALRAEPYRDIYERLLSDGTFGVLLLDRALLQFSYEGSGPHIIRHRLAYLPSPDLNPFQNDADAYICDMQFVEIVGHQIVPVPVRFDYDAREGVSEDVSHPVSHLTLGQYKHCRIPVDRAVSPSEFTTFIIKSFYTTPQIDSPVFPLHVTELPSTITERERAQAHVRLSN